MDTLVIQARPRIAEDHGARLADIPVWPLQSKSTTGFISPFDREYLESLASMGYAEEAARLIDRAYERATSNIVEEPRGRLFTKVDLEYLEVLLTIGQRAKALSFIISAVERFEREAASRLASRQQDTWLDREYRRTIRAIEQGRLLGPPSRQERGKLARLFRRVVRFGQS